MKVLVVAAHPDDEVLGCGGAMARHAAAGHKVDIVFVADGESSRTHAGQADVAVRRATARAAAAVLRCEEPRFLDLPDNRLDSLPLLEVVQRLERAVEQLKPEIVYTHHAGDLNIDHEVATRAVLTAFRPVPGSTVRAIYGFEVLSSTGWNGDAPPFQPVHFADISPVMDKKLEALACYAKELREYPHARSAQAIEALARMRGAIQGVAAAEAFVVYRQLTDFRWAPTGS